MPAAMPNAPFANGGAMAGMQLPDSAVAQADNPHWHVPQGWQISAGSQVRRASFAVTEGEQAVDISVTSFPGDVGGLTQNINRWRSQIGLPGLSPAEAEAAVSPLESTTGEWLLAEIENDGQATLAALTMHAGNSWFFKMTGPKAALPAHEDEFLAFVKSAKFPGHE